jgi:hypothetical protein
MADGGAHSQSPRFFWLSRGALHLMIARTPKALHPIQTESSSRLWYF